MTATPRPWFIDQDSESGAVDIRCKDQKDGTAWGIATVWHRPMADAALIVRAVNAHDELVAFVADVVEHLTRRGPIDELTWRDDQRFTDEHGDPLTFVDSARALLARLKRGWIKADSADLP